MSNLFNKPPELPGVDDIKQICENCRYFSATNSVHVCRRLPPNPEFPAVAVDDWCGEFALNNSLQKIQRNKILEKLSEIRANREEDMRVKAFNGYSTSSTDYVISGCRLIQTCVACPEQYDVFDDYTGCQIGYLRLRSGVFRADLRGAGGTTVYSANTKGDGTFENDERMPELRKAVKAIKKALIADAKNVKRAQGRSYG
jgi:hypothetical protein